MKTLIIGTGFIGSVLTDELRKAGVEVTQSSRSSNGTIAHIPDGTALDRHLTDHQYDQIVVVGQLTSGDIDWVIERIDGPRWLLLSSQQVTSVAPAPQTNLALAHEAFALERGACVLRPTMVYGKGRDVNISRLIRLMNRWRIAVVPGSGKQLLQPIHVDDLAALIAQHGIAPQHGLISVGGPEALPLAELISTIAQIVGIRAPLLGLSPKKIRLTSRLAPMVGIRTDQLARLTEDKTAENTLVEEIFHWQPLPLGLRLEQAVAETRPEGSEV